MLRKPFSFFGNLLFKKLKVKETVVDRLERFPKEIIKITEKLLADETHVIRSAEYLNWRFFDNPDQHYDAFASENGYVIITSQQTASRRIGFIIDLVARDTQTCLTLLNKAVQELAGKVDSIKCLRHSSISSLLRKKGFTSFPKRKQLLIARINVDGSADLAPEYLNNWFLSFGDCDFI